jgi:hypothetical protein
MSVNGPLSGRSDDSGWGVSINPLIEALRKRRDKLAFIPAPRGIVRLWVSRMRPARRLTAGSSSGALVSEPLCTQFAAIVATGRGSTPYSRNINSERIMPAKFDTHPRERKRLRNFSCEAVGSRGSKLILILRGAVFSAVAVIVSNSSAARLTRPSANTAQLAESAKTARP